MILYGLESWKTPRQLFKKGDILQFPTWNYKKKRKKSVGKMTSWSIKPEGNAHELDVCQERSTIC